MQPLWVLLGRLASQHLLGMSANKLNQQIKLSGSSIQTVTVTVMSHMTCMVIRNVMQALGTFVDAQDNCHTAVPAFPKLRPIHLVIEAADHNLQGCTQNVG